MFESLNRTAPPAPDGLLRDELVAGQRRCVARIRGTLLRIDSVERLFH
jgi:hypothetical protein